VDFEDSRLTGIKVRQLDQLIQAFQELTGKVPRYVFLDEVHRVGNYGEWFRKRIDTKVFLPAPPLP
jgi:predicted AAA+ superfamily ATPase